MRVTYLAHSGFLVETDAAGYLFDPIRGTLPDLDGAKPLYAFASHVHGDHFAPDFLFAPALYARVTAYFLSDDIKKSGAGLPAGAEAKVIRIGPDETRKENGFTLETLPSTDEGVAFVLTETGGTALYHAGDLNLWYWEGEDPAWNAAMTRDYTRTVARLSGRRFDAAFVPLDPRLESAAGLGLKGFLDNARAAHVFPMHCWGDYGIIPRFIGENPAYAEKTVIHAIEKENTTDEI